MVFPWQSFHPLQFQFLHKTKQNQTALPKTTKKQNKTNHTEPYVETNPSMLHMALMHCGQAGTGPTVALPTPQGALSTVTRNTGEVAFEKCVR